MRKISVSALPEDYDLLCALMFDCLYRGEVPPSLGHIVDPGEGEERVSAFFYADAMADVASTSSRAVSVETAAAFLGGDVDTPDMDFDGVDDEPETPNCYSSDDLASARARWNEVFFPVNWPAKTGWKQGNEQSETLQ